MAHISSQLLRLVSVNKLLLIPLFLCTVGCQLPQSDVIPIEPVKVVHAGKPFVFTRIVRRLVTNGVSTIHYKSPDGKSINGDVVCDITVRYLQNISGWYSITVNHKPIGSLSYANQPHRITKKKGEIYYTYRYQFRDAVYYEFEIDDVDGKNANHLFIDSIRIERN